MNLPLPVRVAGTGLHLPAAVITNEQLTRTLDTSDEWIVSRTGIHERRRLATDLAVSDMCVAAAEPVLCAAQIGATNIDVIIVATYTYDHPLPSTALIVKDRLKARNALPLDVTQAACTNGLHAMLLAAHLLQTTASTALIIAADCASRVTDPMDRTTSVFFGDAACAVLLTRTDSEEAGLLSWDFGSELSDAVTIPAGGSRMPASSETVAARMHYLQMDGRAVWKAATTRLPESITAAVTRAGLRVKDIQHFFVHQANLNILTSVLAQLGVPPRRAPVTVDILGNTGSAGAFTALDRTVADGKLRRGDLYVVSAIGAGFQWGTLCFRHG